MKIINKNYLSEQYLKDDKLLINHNYLKQQFKNSKKILSDIKKLIKNGTISGGMIPKIETCVNAVRKGVKAAVILNGKVRHAILLEIFTERGVGTLITS